MLLEGTLQVKNKSLNLSCTVYNIMMHYFIIRYYGIIISEHQCLLHFKSYTNFEIKSQGEIQCNNYYHTSVSKSTLAGRVYNYHGSTLLHIDVTIRHQIAGVEQAVNHLDLSLLQL